MKQLLEIQSRLSVPKGQMNTFGNYKYRSCEDILEAVKPFLSELKCTLTLCDTLINIGDRYYVMAEATLTNDDGEFVMVPAYAREAEIKKGMDAAQITGAASSYARKYALAGLFLLDDNQDADTMDNRQTSSQVPDNKKASNPVKTISEAQEKKVFKLIDQYDADLEGFLIFFKIKHIGDMPVSSFKTAVDMLEAKGLSG